MTDFTTQVQKIGVESVQAASRILRINPAVNMYPVVASDPVGVVLDGSGHAIEDGGTISCFLGATPTVAGKQDTLRPWNSPMLSVALVALTKNLTVTGTYDSGSWLSMNGNPSILSVYVCANS